MESTEFSKDKNYSNTDHLLTERLRIVEDLIKDKYSEPENRLIDQREARIDAITYVALVWADNQTAFLKISDQRDIEDYMLDCIEINKALTDARSEGNWTTLQQYLVNQYKIDGQEDMNNDTRLRAQAFKRLGNIISTGYIPSHEGKIT